MHEAIQVLQDIRITAFPALLILPLWPLFMLLPPRAAKTFFIVSGAGLLLLVAGPAIAAGILAAVLAGYALTEWIAGLGRGRVPAFVVALIFVHLAFLACFHLPLPKAFAEHPLEIRPADQPILFVLMSGVGLTFFRLVSHMHDRARLRGERVRFWDFVAYMLYFPQLRHGPIERCAAFSQQLTAARANWTWFDFRRGLLRVGWAILLWIGILWVAGRIAVHGRHFEKVDLLAHPEQLNLAEILVLILLPPIGLYALESMWAHLQLGISRMFGVRGSENYNYPLLATSPQNVWNRWNITFSHWLRDYAFRPLGGSFHHLERNFILTFLYCGLLHGTQMRALVWGLYTGLTIAIGLHIRRMLKVRRRQLRARTHPAVAGLRVAVARLFTWHWAGFGTLILLDPDYLGWRVVQRYFALLLQAFRW